MISSHFTIERGMVWVEKYLIDIYDKVPLLGAMALFINKFLFVAMSTILVMPCAVSLCCKIHEKGQNTPPPVGIFQIPQMHIGAAHSAQRMRLKYFRNTKISVTH